MHDDPDPRRPQPEISPAWFVVPMSVAAAVLIAMSAQPEPAAPAPPPVQQSPAPAIEVPEL